MPELPEVQALVDYLADRTVGLRVTRVDVASIQALKTFDPPVTALVNLVVAGIGRRGKFLDVMVDAPGTAATRFHLVLHLARAGWIRWAERADAGPVRSGRGPLALRLVFDDQSSWSVTEQGTKKRLAVYAVRELNDVPGIQRLGVDPLGAEFTHDRWQEIAGATSVRVKKLLVDQSAIAGIGNAYSDEILHAARVSPFATARNLDALRLDRLYNAIGSVLRAAVANAQGLAAGELKAGKKLTLRVHGKDGEACPVCGDAVRSVHFADSSFQYCPTCQTGGKILADRRMSRLLK